MPKVRRISSRDNSVPKSHFLMTDDEKVNAIESVESVDASKEKQENVVTFHPWVDTKVFSDDIDHDEDGQSISTSWYTDDDQRRILNDVKRWLRYAKYPMLCTVHKSKMRGLEHMTLDGDDIVTAGITKKIKMSKYLSRQAVLKEQYLQWDYSIDDPEYLASVYVAALGVKKEHREAYERGQSDARIAARIHAEEDDDQSKSSKMNINKISRRRRRQMILASTPVPLQHHRLAWQ